MDNSENSTASDVLLSPNTSNEDDKPLNCCDPRSTIYRYLGLILMCLLGFGKILITFYIYL